MKLPTGVFDVKEATTPATTPAAGRRLLYVKADGKQYTKNSAGVESLNVGGIARIAAAVATSGTTEAVILNAQVLANVATVGTTFRVTLFGVTSGSGNPTFKIHLGSAGTIADTLAATIGPITHTVAAGGMVDFMVTVRAIGSSGTAMVNGTASVGIVANAQTAAAPVATTVNTTAAFYITLTATMSALAFTAHTAVIEVVNT